jgi:hypothetical protein
MRPAIILLPTEAPQLGTQVIGLSELVLPPGMRPLQIEDAGVYVIRPAKTKHTQQGHSKRRNWGKNEYVQAAIHGLRRDPTTDLTNITKFTEKINKELAQDPNYHFGEISRQTTTRVLAAMRSSGDLSN